MIADIAFAHGRERAVAHVEGHLGPAEPGPGQGLAHAGREMQPGRGRGHGPGLGRVVVHRLVALGVFGRVGPGNVRGQRHMALLGQTVHEGAGPGQVHQATAELAALHHAQAQAVAPVGPEIHHLPRLGGLGGAQEPLHPGRGPAVRAAIRVRRAFNERRRGEQQELHAPARGLAPEEPGRDHPRIVGHQQGVRGQQAGQVREGGLARLTGIPVQDHEPGGVAPLGRCLGDTRLGQVIAVGAQIAVRGDMQGAHAVIPPPGPGPAPPG